MVFIYLETSANTKHLMGCDTKDLDSVMGLDDVFKDVPDPFDGIETCRLQENYYRDTLGLIVSLT